MQRITNYTCFPVFSASFRFTANTRCKQGVISTLSACQSVTDSVNLSRSDVSLLKKWWFHSANLHTHIEMCHRDELVYVWMNIKCHRGQPEAACASFLLPWGPKSKPSFFTARRHQVHHPWLLLKNKSLREFTNVSVSPSLPPPLCFSPSSSGPLASSRPDQDVGGIQRDQRQKAASREPQTHRNGE